MPRQIKHGRPLGQLRMLQHLGLVPANCGPARLHRRWSRVAGDMNPDVAFDYRINV